jgi:hypothetical protein
MSDVLQAPVTLGLGALLGLAGGLLGWCVYRGVAVGPPRGSTPASVGRAAAALGHGAGDLGGGVTGRGTRGAPRGPRPAAGHHPRGPQTPGLAGGGGPLLTTRHLVDFAYTRPELEALFQYARDHDVEAGGRYDARSACLLLWSHYWLHPATREESETIGAFYVRWTDPPTLWEIETDEGFTLEDLMAELGRLELQALDYVKHGDVPQDRGRTDERL